MASICLKKFRGGVDAQRKIKEKRMEEEADEAAEAAAVASSKARRVGEGEVEEARKCSIFHNYRAGS